MSYEEDGFVVYQNFFGKSALNDINHDIASLFRMQASHLHAENADLLENAKAVLNSDPEVYVNTLRVTQDLPSVHRMLTSTWALSIARRLGVEFPLISTKASVHFMHPDLVVPGGYHRSPPHQDWYSIRGSSDNVVLWIPTTPVRGNGLEVVRGSHRLGLLPTVPHKMTPAVQMPHATWDAIDCDPGDVIAFSSFLVHRTAEGDGLRIALSTRFNNAMEPSFIARGYPTNYRYTYNIEAPA